MIEFRCPDCDKNYQADERLEGRRFRCSYCGRQLVVPGQEAGEEVVNLWRGVWIYPVISFVIIVAVIAAVFFSLPGIRRLADRMHPESLQAFGVTVLVMSVAGGYAYALYMFRDVRYASAAVGRSLSAAKVALFVAVGMTVRAILVALTSLNTDGTPGRPLSCCPDCGYTWHPRGRNDLTRCPNCG